MEQDMELNIHYSAPDEVWEKISQVYRSMPYWDEQSKAPHWCGEGIDLYTSLEPGGIQISGEMPDDIWNEWCITLKQRLTKALGYEIGEPIDSYAFKYWEPFEKSYSEIKEINKNAVIFNDLSRFYWNMFNKTEQHTDGEKPCIIFSSELIELRIFFEEQGQLAKARINEFCGKLDGLGVVIE